MLDFIGLEGWSWAWGVLTVIAALFAYLFGRVRERLRWIRLLQNPPDPKDMAWFDRRIVAPFREESDLAPSASEPITKGQSWGRGRR